ncbi:GTPase-activating protein [Balamuthia mandrillaris]
MSQQNETTTLPSLVLTTSASTPSSPLLPRFHNNNNTNDNNESPKIQHRPRSGSLGSNVPALSNGMAALQTWSSCRRPKNLSFTTSNAQPPLSGSSTVGRKSPLLAMKAAAPKKKTAIIGMRGVSSASSTTATTKQQQRNMEERVLRKVLRHQELRDLFREHLKQLFCEENVDFWQQTKAYKVFARRSLFAACMQNVPNPQHQEGGEGEEEGGGGGTKARKEEQLKEKRKKRATLLTSEAKEVQTRAIHILRTFVQPNAVKEVNLPSAMKKDLIHSTPTFDAFTFDAARKSIFNLMKNSLVSNFIESDLYQQTMMPTTTTKEKRDEKENPLSHLPTIILAKVIDLNKVQLSNLAVTFSLSSVVMTHGNKSPRIRTEGGGEGGGEGEQATKAKSKKTTMTASTLVNNRERRHTDQMKSNKEKISKADKTNNNNNANNNNSKRRSLSLNLGKIHSGVDKIKKKKHEDEAGAEETKETERKEDEKEENQTIEYLLIQDETCLPHERLFLSLESLLNKLKDEKIGILASSSKRKKRKDTVFTTFELREWLRCHLELPNKEAHLQLILQRLVQKRFICVSEQQPFVQEGSSPNKDLLAYCFPVHSRSIVEIVNDDSLSFEMDSWETHRLMAHLLEPTEECQEYLFDLITDERIHSAKDQEKEKEKESEEQKHKEMEKEKDAVSHLELSTVQRLRRMDVKEMIDEFRRDSDSFAVYLHVNVRRLLRILNGPSKLRSALPDKDCLYFDGIMQRLLRNIWKTFERWKAAEKKQRQQTLRLTSSTSQLS